MPGIIQIIPASDYEAKKARLAEQMRSATNVRLGKPHSNLFRARKETQQYLNVRDFDRVISINTEEHWAEVEGMTTYENFVKETLKYGYMPAVVPQLKTITIGGAIAGVGIEASSFRYGLVHETVMEMEVLLSSGDTVLCDAHNNTDLFYNFPNSYGTLGYALRLKVTLIPVKPFVKLSHTRHSDATSYFQALEKISQTSNTIDFVDGSLFSPTEMYITTGTFVDEAPSVSDYTYMDIYYRSIQKKTEDHLSVSNFIWRWDTDWFWCSKAFGAQNKFLRMFYGRKHLNSAVYWKLRKFALKYPLLITLSNRFVKKEDVIQDIEVPIENAPAFADFFFENINIRPTWICPVHPYDKTKIFGLYRLDPEKLYINFGFWDAVASSKGPGHYNKLIETKVSELHGNKSLYSDSFYTPEEFWKIYNKHDYDALKAKYDPCHKLKGLYEKCVARA